MTCPNPLDGEGLPKAVFVDDVSSCPFCGSSDLTADSYDLFQTSFNCSDCSGFFEWSGNGDLVANQNFLYSLK